jgi:hypothetical protein
MSKPRTYRASSNSRIKMTGARARELQIGGLTYTTTWATPV